VVKLHCTQSTVKNNTSYVCFYFFRGVKPLLHLSLSTICYKLLSFAVCLRIFTAC